MINYSQTSQHSVTESILLLSSLSPLLKGPIMTKHWLPIHTLTLIHHCLVPLLVVMQSGCLPLQSLVAILSWFLTGSITTQGTKEQLSPCPCSISLVLLSLNLLYPLSFSSLQVPVGNSGVLDAQASRLSEHC